MAGLICGVLCFPFAFFAASLRAILPAGPPGVILPMAFFSALAGIVAYTVARRDPPEPASFALRGAIRASLVATLAGGALTVFAATLHGFGIGHSVELSGTQIPVAFARTGFIAYQVLIITLFGIPPSIFFGTSGALLAALLRSPRQSPNLEGEAVAEKPARSVLFICVLALSAVGYLSPFTPALRPKPKPIVVPPAVEAPTSTVPPAPKWHYEKPDSFDTAEAGRITVIDRRILGEIESAFPVALSPNGRLFACFRREERLVLEVRDLDTFDVVARADGVEEPASLAWSPDGKMLLFSVESKVRHLFVFDTASSRLMLLPQPKNARVPEGYLNWWDAEEVLFVSGTVATLNLDTLRVCPSDESPKWKALAKSRQDEAKAMPTHLPSVSRWQMRLTGAVRGYDVPLNPASDWSYRETLQLAFLLPDKAYRFVQSEVDVNVNDAVVAATDGTKLVRIRNRQAMIFYFGVRAEPPARFKVSMPSAPDAALTDSLAKKTVCAFVCAPLVNPLNGKTVGPDREQVKAIARAAAWKDKDAEFWIAEDYLPIQTGDVVADLHTWEARVPHGAGELAKSEWFAMVGNVDTHTAPPARSEAPALDREVTLEFNGWRGSDRLDRIAPSRTRAPTLPKPAANAPPPTTEPPGFRDDDSEPQPITSKNAENALLVFLQNHHAKSSRGDVQGLIADYADRVDHFNNGIVDREFIRKDEIAYHGPGIRVTETMKTRPAFVSLSPTTYSATYSISFQRVHPDGKWTSGISDIALQIEFTPSGLRIVKQRAANRNQQKGG